MYYGLSLNVGNFGLDIFLTQFIFGLVEIPARLGCLPLMQRFGRRICQAGVLFFGGSACLGILGVPNGNVLHNNRNNRNLLYYNTNLSGTYPYLFFEKKGQISFL